MNYNKFYILPFLENVMAFRGIKRFFKNLVIVGTLLGPATGYALAKPTIDSMGNVRAEYAQVLESEGENKTKKELEDLARVIGLALQNLTVEVRRANENKQKLSRESLRKIKEFRKFLMSIPVYNKNFKRMRDFIDGIWVDAQSTVEMQEAGLDYERYQGVLNLHTERGGVERGAYKQGNKIYYVAQFRMQNPERNSISMKKARDQLAEALALKPDSIKVLDMLDFVYTYGSEDVTTVLQWRGSAVTKDGRKVKAKDFANALPALPISQ